MWNKADNSLRQCAFYLGPTIIRHTSWEGRNGPATFVLTGRHGTNNRVTESGGVRRALFQEMDLTPLRHSLIYFTRRGARMRRNRRQLRQVPNRFRPDVVFLWGMWKFNHAIPALAETRCPRCVGYRFAEYGPTLASQHTLYWQALARSIPGQILKRRNFAPLALALLAKEPQPLALNFEHILGLGFGNHYWYTLLFHIRTWAVQFNSHHNLVDTAVQTGKFGLRAFLWFAWELFRLGLRLRGTVPQGSAQAYMYGTLRGLAGTRVAAVLGDWLLPSVHNVGMNGFRTGVVAWLFLGGLMALGQIHLYDEAAV